MFCCIPRLSHKTAGNITDSELKSSLNKNVDQSISFPEQIAQSIQIRNCNIEQIKQFILNNSNVTSDTNKCLRICDTVVDRPIIMTVVGRLNSGKSMLVSALLDWEIVLPSSDEATTGRLTRFIYSPTPIIRKIESGQYSEAGFLRKFQECQLSEDELNEDLLSQYLHLPRQDRVDVPSLSTIIEIGIPSELLKCGLTIIDCPGLDENEILSNIEMELLKEMNPSILCYVYDHKQGFGVKDGQRIREFFQRGLCYYKALETLIVANKCDSFEQNIIDCNVEGSSYSFDQEQVNTSIRNNCPWIYLMSDPYFDKDRLLPVVPLSSGKLFLSEYNPDVTQKPEDELMLKNLQRHIASKIIKQSRSILTWMAIKLSLKNINLYFKFKSLLIDEHFTELITIQCNLTENLLVDFKRGYQVFGLNYEGDEIHVTKLTKTTEIDFQQERKRIFMDKKNVFYSLICESEETSIIYLIEKERAHKRLIDNLHEYSLTQKMNFQSQLVNLIHSRLECYPNFRPDNVYVNDKLATISLNISVPNHPNLPFLLKDQIAVRPFHLHPQLPYPNPDKADNRNELIQMMYSLGCLFWILIEGRGSTWIESTNSDYTRKSIEVLQKGSIFPSYPEELEEVMRCCWNNHPGDKIESLVLNMEEMNSLFNSVNSSLNYNNL